MLNILIVEDSVEIAKALGMILKKKGIRIYYKHDGLNIVETIKKKKIGLVLLDLMLPKKSGEQVLKEVRLDSATRDVMVVVMTAKTVPLDWENSLKACDGFLQKPFDNEELLGMVSSVVSNMALKEKEEKAAKKAKEKKDVSKTVTKKKVTKTTKKTTKSKKTTSKSKKK